MEKHENVVQIGVGVNTPWYVGNTMAGLIDRFGQRRLIDTPVSENGISGMAIGAAMVGLRPVLMFPRMDFMYYAMDQLCNHAALLNYTFGGKTPIPLTIRAIINRGGEQAAQHSQAIQAMFMHVPGFKVIMPSNPYDAKGMLISAIESDYPVIYIDDRWLYNEEGDVPEGYYTVSLDKASVIHEGKDITLITSSFLTAECTKAVKELLNEGIQTEQIDLRSIKPLDSETIIASVKKTGRVLIVDGGWKTGGVSAELCAIIATEGYNYLKEPIKRLTLPDLPAPANPEQEKYYYFTASDIVASVRSIISP